MEIDSMSIQAIKQAYKQRDFATVRALLAPVLEADPNNELGLAIFMNVAETAEEQQQALETLLKINPENPHALKKQQQLQSLKQPELEPLENTNAADVEDVADVADVYEMLWDCEYCGSKKLLGKTHRFCPNCGGTQNPGQRYFPADDEKIAVKNHQYVGADKICAACNSANAANVKFCPNCGAAMEDAETVGLAVTEVKAENEVFIQSESINEQQSLQQARQIPTPKKSARRIWMILGTVVFIIGVLLFWTENKTVTVSGHFWHHQINIEDYASRHESDWCDRMPGDAYSVSRNREIRSYRKIPDGQQCFTKRIDRGDGTYRETQECETKYREEPIYDQHCDYRVNRWAYSRAVVASAMDKNPYWPQYTLTCTEQRLGCERAAGQVATYSLYLHDAAKNKTHQCKVEPGFWQAAPLNSKWQMDVGRVLGDAHCSSLQAVAD